MGVFLFIFAAYCSTITASRHNPARATSYFEGQVYDPRGWTPRPTLGPRTPHELLQRQDTSSSLLIGPDRTCGFISGLAGAGFTCPLSDTCVLFPATQSDQWGNVTCCDVSDCGVRVACVDSAQYSVSSLCDNGCREDSMTLKCTKSPDTFCASIRFPGARVEDYFCDSTNIKTWQTGHTTFDGETDGRVFSTYIPSDNGTFSTSFTSITSGSSTNAAPSASAIPQNASDPTSSTKSTKSSDHTGAIVGGTIGGVALMVLVAAFLWLALHRRRRNKQAASSTQAPPSYSNVPSGSGSGSPVMYKTPMEQAHQGLYDPLSPSIPEGFGFFHARQSHQGLHIPPSPYFGHAQSISAVSVPNGSQISTSQGSPPVSEIADTALSPPPSHLPLRMSVVSALTEDASVHEMDGTDRRR